MSELPTPQNPIVLVEPEPAVAQPPVEFVVYEPDMIEVVTAAAFLPTQDVAKVEQI